MININYPVSKARAHSNIAVNQTMMSRSLAGIVVGFLIIMVCSCSDQNETGFNTREGDSSRGAGTSHPVNRGSSGATDFVTASKAVIPAVVQ